MSHSPQHEEWTPEEAWPETESGDGPDRPPPVARLGLGLMMGIVFYFAAHNALFVLASSLLRGPRYRVRVIQALILFAVNILATGSIATYLWARWHYAAEQRCRGSRSDWTAERFDYLLALVVSILAIGYGALFFYLKVLSLD